MFMSSDPYFLLRERRKLIRTEIAAYRAEIEALETEDQELAAAERVMSRFVAEGAVEAEPVKDGEAQPTGKPAGTPTTPNMILSLLREAAAQGKPGLEPREMQMAISKRWWPSVKSEDVAPTAWRMWKDGRLVKSGSVYMIPNSSAAADLLGERATAAD